MLDSLLPPIKSIVPLETPEILGLIPQHLSRNDLAKCALVSRFWHTVFHPQLWETFDDSIEPWNNTLEMASRTSADQYAFVLSGFHKPPADNMGKDEAWVRSVIGKNSKYIRHLIVKWALTLEACIQSGECTNVISFKNSILPYGNFFRDIPSFVTPWEQWVPDIPASFFVTENNPEGTLQDWYHPFIARALRFMWQFILQNPGLEELVLNPVQSSDYLSFLPPKPFLYNALQSLTRLRRLEGLSLDNDDFALLRTLTPKLECFSPGNSNLESTGFVGESVSEKGIEALTDVNTKMKVIKFRTSISSRHQAKILEHMPELRELHVGGEFQGGLAISSDQNLHINADSLRIWSVPHFYSLLHPNFTHSTKNLQELRIQMVNYGVNGLVELMRRVNPDLRVLDIDCFVRYPIEHWHRGLVLPLPPALDPKGALPQFNLRSLRLSGLSSSHVLFSPARPRDEHIIEQAEDLTAGSVWWGCFPNLVEFVAQFVAPATLIGIADNCPQLEILDVSLAQKGSSAVAYVLTTCAKLKSFLGKGHMVDAAHVVEGPAWVCSDIERLHLEVQGIPRAEGVADGQCQGASEALALDISKARELSIGVYKRIGQLTKLRELDLGGYTYLPDRLEHTLCAPISEQFARAVSGIRAGPARGAQEPQAHWCTRSGSVYRPRGAGLDERALAAFGFLDGNPGDYSAKNGQIAKLIKETLPSVRLDDWVWTKELPEDNC
ncbi:hypothetical protein BGZ82_002253 [Podila clonocystis]|nr:hypothetical protein BGZ82_002253 [Podila clonocystis]